MTDLRQHLGRLGEQLAAEHLVRLGWTIIDRNRRTRAGELDLIAYDGHTMVFVEVKTRRSDRYAPVEAIDRRKLARVRSAAAAWLVDEEDRPRPRAIRIDAIGVLIDGRDRLVGLDHLEGVFDDS